MEFHYVQQIVYQSFKKLYQIARYLWLRITWLTHSAQVIHGFASHLSIHFVHVSLYT